MTAALANAASAAVASLDSVAHTARVKLSKHGRKSYIPHPTDLKIPRLTDVNGAFLFYAFCNRTGRGQETCVFFS